MRAQEGGGLNPYSETVENWPKQQYSIKDRMRLWLSKEGSWTQHEQEQWQEKRATHIQPSKPQTTMHIHQGNLGSKGS